MTQLPGLLMSTGVVALRRITQDGTRIERAQKNLPEVQATKPPAKKDEARVSTTDPDARPMKMADGGFRPAFNVQLAVDTESRVIVGVDGVSTGEVGS